MDNKVILERACSLANEYMFTVALQCRRIRTAEPEDKVFVMRRWIDLQFLILALYRLRTAVKIAVKIPTISKEMRTALNRFDKAIPDLKKLRDIGEHIDEYAVDHPRRHVPSVDRKQLQVGSWDGTVYEWLGVRLNVDEANNAAEELFKTLQKIKNLERSL